MGRRNVAQLGEEAAAFDQEARVIGVSGDRLAKSGECYSVVPLHDLHAGQADLRRRLPDSDEPIGVGRSDSSAWQEGKRAMAHASLRRVPPCAGLRVPDGQSSMLRTVNHPLAVR